MLTPVELEQMRDTTAAAMPDVASFQTRAVGRNAMGGRDNTLGDVAGMGAVPCHVHPMKERGASEGDLQGVVAGDHRYRIVFPYGTLVTDHHIVTVGGLVYEITSVDAGRSWALEVEAFAVRRS